MTSKIKEYKEKDVNKLPTDYKAKLEGKLYIAKETPEPVFDISSCDLKHIPHDIFNLFKNLKKEALYLQNNHLTNLDEGGMLGDLQGAKILDISNNKFSKLPHDLGVFENLEVLDASKNHLKDVPNTIGSLKCLVRLDLSNNNLHSLPDSIGNCKNLEVLNLTFNKPLKKLPKTLGKLTSLSILNFDSTVKYPPKEVSDKGVPAILNFLLKELHEIPSSSKNNKVMKNESYSRLQQQIELNEKLKLEKQKQLLEIEKKMSADHKKELDLSQKSVYQKAKLIQEVRNKEEALKAELNKVQEKKNAEHASLLKACLEDEKKSADTVYRMLHNNAKLRKKLAESWENAKKEESEMLKMRTTSKTIEKQTILSSMNEVMREEIEKAQKLSAEKHSYAVQSLANEISNQNASLQKLISKFDQTHSQFVDTLVKNEELQKSAVASLLEKTDSISWKLKKQIVIIESELAELTRIELSKRKLETNYQIAELNKNRIALTELLMELFKQQGERRKQLINRIRKMESLKNSENYWMVQYDKLLNSKSHQTVKCLEAVDQKLAHEMFVMGVFHYLSLLCDVALCEEKLAKLDEKTLIYLGIHNAEERNLILKAVENYLNFKQNRIVPSAPKLSPSEISKTSYSSPKSIQSTNSKDKQPSAPSAAEVGIHEKANSYSVPDECVICLEKKPKIIFVPCGHICCCYKCYLSLSKCPLCRKQIVAVHEYNV